MARGRGQILLLAVLSCIVPAAWAASTCTPCCDPSRMAETMVLTNVGKEMKTVGGSPCHIEVFDRGKLHAALASKWLYFLGDSSTRGLVLALYYEVSSTALHLNPLRPPTPTRLDQSARGGVGGRQSARGGGRGRQGGGRGGAEANHGALQLRRCRVGSWPRSVGVRMGRGSVDRHSHT